MPLAIRCPTCKATLKAPDAAAGRTLNCPGCKTPVTFPAAKPKPAPAASHSTLPDEMPRLKDDPHPPKAPAIPDMTLPEDRPLRDERPAARTAPSAKQPEEVYGDFEVIEDEEETVEEVLPAEEEEELDELEVVGEDDMAEVEEVVPADAGECSAYDDSRLLRLGLLHIRGRTGSLVSTMMKMDNAEYDILDPDSGKRVGEALEVRSSGQQAVRFFVGRALMDTRVEICEGRDRAVLATIRRPPYLWESALEVLDADDRVLATFKRAPFQALTGQPIWLMSPGGRKLLRMEPRIWEGKMLFLTRDGKKVGEMMTEAAYERRIKIQWNPRGGRYYFSFKRELDARPLDKLLFLCGGLGIDLFATEAEAD